MDWQKKEWHIPKFFENGNGSVEKWENGRREELMNLFSKEVYGVTPKQMPDRTEVEVLEDNPRDRGGKNHYKRLLYHMYFGDQKLSMEIHQWTPFGKGPFPVQLLIDPFEYSMAEYESFYARYPYFPSDFITDRGYAAVKVLTSTICFDSKERAYEGVLSILTGEKEGIPEESRWGAIGAWAWGASRCIDYLETQSEMDTENLAINGLSRAGKTALWCAAQEKRIKVVQECCSGLGGAALTRGKTGEHVKDITTTFPFWFCKKYATYAEDEDLLPVDAHMLMAMAAPRPLYVSSSTHDIWADMYAEYKSLYLSTEVFKLYDPELVIPSVKPESNKPFHIGDIGYHTRDGLHDMDYYDWEQYLNFCDHYMMEGGYKGHLNHSYN